MTTYQDYINTFRSGLYKQKIKIDLLYNDEKPREEITSLITNTNGSLSVQRANGIRRSASFDIINLDNTYIPNIENFWVHQKLQLYLGLEMPDGTDFWIPNGLMVLNDPSTSSNFSESYIKINCTDKFSLLDGSLGGELGFVHIIPVNADVNQAIVNTLALAKDPKYPIIDSFLIGKKVPYTMTYQPTDTLGKILVDLSQLYSCSIYYNSIGQLVVERDIDDNTKNPLWDFSYDEFTYGGATNTYKWSEIYNSVLTVGSNINGSTVSYKAQNLNLLSNTSIPNLNNFERIYYYQSDSLSTQQQCKDLSEYILKRKTSVQNSVQINSIPLYFLEPDELITLTDPKLGLEKERFIINGFSIPLSTGGRMSINCVKSKEIPFI